MTVEIAVLLAALLSGATLGAFYFGTLWFTVSRLAVARRPAFLMFGSFFVRTAATLLGFYLVMGGQWERLLVCLLGFMAMRGLMVRRWKPNP